MLIVDVEEVARLMILCLMTAWLSLFIWKCMESEMILRRYYLWLVYHWIKWRRKADRKKRWILKPLGLCIYCMSAWINIISFCIFIHQFEYIFFSLGINFVFMELSARVIKFEL